MCTKWMNPKKYNLKVENIEREAECEVCFEDLHRRAMKLARSEEQNIFLDLYDQEEKGAKIYQKNNMVNPLKILLDFGKLRKNFLHFVCQNKDDEQRISNFIAGIEPILGEELNLGKKKLPG